MTYHVTLDKSDILFFCSLFESTERFAFVRTLEKEPPLLEVVGVPDYTKELEEYFTLVAKSVKFKILGTVDEVG